MLNILRYRHVTPKARVIELSPTFLDYLRSDGIILPPDDVTSADTTQPISDAEYRVAPGDATERLDKRNDDDDASATASDSDSVNRTDPSLQWPDIHQSVRLAIAELGGKVAPKMNWSAPKDARWIATTNTLECRTPNDVYLLLKSSNLISHDLEHVFDGCVPPPDADAGVAITAGTMIQDQALKFQHYLVLRKYVNMNPSVEFRCFVRRRQLIGICQRDLNSYDFLVDLKAALSEAIVLFYQKYLESSFPDEDFVFDVYIPAHQNNRVWLIDINPWAPRTDPILYTWPELLTMAETPPSSTSAGPGRETGREEATKERSYDSCSTDEEHVPQFRLWNKDDPTAISLIKSQYGANRMPRDVVDAGSTGPLGMLEFAQDWREIVKEWENCKTKGLNHHPDTESTETTLSER